MNTTTQKATVFEETYRNYLKQLSAIDYLARADVLGVEISGAELVIEFYGNAYRISKAGITDSSGKRANFAVSVLLCKYILTCPQEVMNDGTWVTYREFRDAGPLMEYFTTNTNKIVETSFSGRLDLLEKACRKLGARPLEDGASYDLSLMFKALPRIPVLLRFNDGDEEFPAQCSILFRQSAEQYLDMESLAIAGTFLAGNLIQT